MSETALIYLYPSLREIPEQNYYPIQMLCIKIGDVGFAVLAAWVQSNPQKAKELAGSGDLLKLMKRYYQSMDDAQLTLAENTHLSVIEAAQLHEIPLKLSLITE